MYGNGYQIARVAISASNGPRASLFAPAAKEIFGLGGTGFNPALAGYILGQTTAQQFYDQAKKEIARFDSYVERVKRLANTASREEIIDEYGLAEPDNRNKAFGLRNALAGDVAQADKFRLPSGEIPYEQGFPERGPSRRRVDDLHDWNRYLSRDVKESEITYGILPEPVVIERLVQVPGAAAPSVLPYVLVGGGVLAALLVAGVI